MKTTFDISLTDDKHDPYTAVEIKPVNDGDTWRESALEGQFKSMYSAIAKLCFMRLEMQGKTDEIFMLFDYYSGIYPQTARQIVSHIAPRKGLRGRLGNYLVRLGWWLDRIDRH